MSTFSKGQKCLAKSHCHWILFREEVPLISKGILLQSKIGEKGWVTILGKCCTCHDDGWVTFDCTWVEKKRSSTQWQACIPESALYLKIRSEWSKGNIVVEDIKRKKSWETCFEWIANGKRREVGNENQVCWRHQWDRKFRRQGW